MSQRELASRLGVTRLAITRLEAGIGSIPLLSKVMDEIGFRLSGVARGGRLSDQLRARRIRLGMTTRDVAKKSMLDHRTVEAVENGDGTVASLVQLLKALAPAAKRTEPARASWAFDPSSHDERDKRFTPSWFLAHIADAFGPIDLDPCGHELSAVSARRRIILPECGLSSSWAGHRLVFVNPPYSAVTKWMARAASAWADQEVRTIVMLVPVRTDSETYQARVSRDAHTLFLGGRMRFESAQGIAWPAPFSLMLLIWGGSEEQIARFRDLVPAVHLRPWGRIDDQSGLSPER